MQKRILLILSLFSPNISAVITIRHVQIQCIEDGYETSIRRVIRKNETIESDIVAICQYMGFRPGALFPTFKYSCQGIENVNGQVVYDHLLQEYINIDSEETYSRHGAFGFRIIKTKGYSY